MNLEEIQIPAEAETTFKALEQGLGKDLNQRGVHTSASWDERLTYRLPESVRGEDCPGAAITVKLMTDTIISIMPHQSGDLPGVWIKHTELSSPNEVAVRCLRNILMRAGKDARKTASRPACAAS